MLMGSATFLIGLVPTYRQIGGAAPVLLVVLRFAQGLAVGGEWGGATLMVIEHAPEKTRYFAGGSRSGRTSPQTAIRLEISKRFSESTSLRITRLLSTS
jgi:MFS family permease